MAFKKQKIIIFLTLVAIFGFFVFTNFALAQTPDLGNQYAGQIGLGHQDIRTTIASIIRTALGLLGIVVVALMIYAGFLWMTAGGEEDKVAQAKKILFNSVIGLAIILSAYAITNFIIKQLTNATQNLPAHCANYLQDKDDPTTPNNNEAEDAIDCGGECMACHGGPIITDYFFNFYIDSAFRGGQLCLRNFHPTLTFTKPVNINTVNTDVFYLTKEEGKVVVVGVWQLAKNPQGADIPNVIEFVPTGDCGGGAGNDCLDANTKYVFNVSPDQQKVSAVKSTGDLSLSCGFKAENCNPISFTSGAAIDQHPPTITIKTPKGDLQSGVSEPITVDFSDDVGVQNIAIHDNNNYLGSAQPDGSCPAPGQLKTGTVQVNWNTTGKGLGLHTLLANGLDWSGKVGSGTSDVDLRGSECYAVPPVCGGSCGKCAGDDCARDADCASGFCDLHLTPPKCVDKMRILGFGPKSGAPETFVTLLGRYFGAQVGHVYFASTTKAQPDVNTPADWVEAFLPNCGTASMWTSNQITVMVPKEATDGPLKVVTGGGTFTDVTNDSWGPDLGIFDVNTEVHPKLCEIVPNQGILGDYVELRGRDLQLEDNHVFDLLKDQVLFGSIAATVTSSANWTKEKVGTTVPGGLATGSFATKVNAKIGGVVRESNTLLFSVAQGVNSTLPFIDGMTPETGSAGEYVTITGNNFGTGVGTVWFKLKGAGVATNGDTTFPKDCDVSVWTNEKILIKFPVGLAVGDYSIEVKRASDQAVSPMYTKRFKLETGSPAPGICKMSPADGPIPWPAANKIAITGEYFQSELWATTNGLVFYHTFDGSDIVNRNSLDRSGSGYNGVVKNAISDAGRIGQALSFLRGTSGNVLFNLPVDNKLEFSDTNFTVSLWYKSNFTQPNANSNIIGRGATRLKSFWKFKKFKGGGSIFFQLYDGATLVQPAFSINGINVLDNSWHNLTGVVDRTTKQVTTYIDGHPGAPMSIAGLGKMITSAQGQSATLAINDNAATNDESMVDDVRIYDRVLKADEIDTIYKIGSGQAARLVDGQNPDVYFSKTGSSIKPADVVATMSKAAFDSIAVLSPGQTVFVRPENDVISGAVLIRRPGDQKISNTLQFKSASCIKNNNTCSVVGAHCCADGTCTTPPDLCPGEKFNAGYVWRFSTREIPAVPKVVEECSDGLNADRTAVIPSPAPSTQWNIPGPNPPANDDNNNVCRTALVTVKFNTAIKASSLNSHVFIRECADGSVVGNKCTAVNVIGLTGDSLKLKVASSNKKGIPNHYLSMQPDSKQWKSNTWYQVVITADVTSDNGATGTTNPINLSPDRSCDSQGDLSGTAYCFVFKTDDRDCVLTGLVVTPERFLTSILSGTDSPIRYKSNGVVQDLVYRGLGKSNQHCILMDISGFDWKWRILKNDGVANSDSAVDTDYAEIYGAADTQPTTRVSSIENTVGAHLTHPDDAVNVEGEVSTSTMIKSLTATSPLTIDLSNPEVVDYWPKCQEACTNAEVGVQFNVNMSRLNLPGDIVGGVVTGPLQLWECDDENCLNPVSAFNPADVRQPSEAESYTVITIANSGKIVRNLKSDTWYKVVISTSTPDDDTHKQQLWSLQSSKTLTSSRKPYDKEFSWRFKTKKTACLIDHLGIEPKEYVAARITDRVIYNGQAFSSPDSCAVGGQKLSPWSVGWAWATSDDKVAKIHTFKTTQLSNKDCTDYCVRKGSDLSKGTQLAFCGNSIIEAGEDCDPPNKATGCSLNCLRTGNNSRASTVNLLQNGGLEDVAKQNLWTQLYLSGDSLSTIGIYSVLTADAASLAPAAEGNYVARLIMGAVPVEHTFLSQTVKNLNPADIYAVSAQGEARFLGAATVPKLALTLQTTDVAGNKFFWNFTSNKWENAVFNGIYPRPVAAQIKKFVLTYDWNNFLYEVPSGKDNLTVYWGLASNEGNAQIVLDDFKLKSKVEGKCGNGVIEKNLGEECDPPNPVLGCSDNCLNLGSKTAGAVGATEGGSICGNGKIGRGEDCDTGITALYTAVSSTMNCSQSCLHTGTPLVKSWCDGAADQRGGYVPADYDNLCSSVYSLCGDTITSSDEDPSCETDVVGTINVNCNDNCIKKKDAAHASKEGYDSHGALRGSSLFYSVPSVCNDGIAGFGEDPFCENGLLASVSSGDPKVLAEGVGIETAALGFDATTKPPQQFANITGRVSDDKKVKDTVATASGKFIIPCGYTTDRECRDVMGPDGVVGINSCCYIRPRLVSVYPATTTFPNLLDGICPNTYLEATFDQPIDEKTLPGNFVIAKGIENHANGVVPAMSGTLLDTSGSKLFAFVNGATLASFDISNPSSPHLLDTISNNNNSVKTIGANSMAVGDKYAYILSDHYLQYVDVTNPADFVVQGTPPLVVPAGATKARFMQVAKKGDISYAFVLVGKDGDANFGQLLVLDVTDAAGVMPKKILNNNQGDFSLNNPLSAKVYGNYLFVALGTGKVEVLNISDPENPVHVSNINLSGPVSSMFVEGNYLYTISKDKQIFNIVNVANPVAPLLAGWVGDPALGLVSDIGVNKKTAYLSTKSADSSVGSVVRINVASSTNPMFMPTVGHGSESMGGINSLKLYNDFIILGGRSSLNLIYGFTYCDGAEDVTSLVAMNTLPGDSRPWYARLWNNAMAWLRGLIWGEASASARAVRSFRWCAGTDLGTAKVVNDPVLQLSKVVVNLDDALTGNTEYAIILKKGVKDTRGISIGGEMASGVPTGKAINWKFATVSEVCAVDEISVNPATYLFNKANETIDLQTDVFSASGQRLQSTASYNWNYVWSPINNGIVSWAETNEAVNHVKSGSINGDITVRVSANVTRAPSSQKKGRVANAESKLSVNLCENAWPPKAKLINGIFQRVWPYEDKAGNNDNFDLETKDFTNTPSTNAAGYYNFSTFYCADSGAGNNIFDDLPYLHPAIQATTAVLGGTAIKKCQHDNAISCNANSDCTYDTPFVPLPLPYVKTFSLGDGSLTFKGLEDSGSNVCFSLVVDPNNDLGCSTSSDCSAEYPICWPTIDSFCYKPVFPAVLRTVCEEGEYGRPPAEIIQKYEGIQDVCKEVGAIGANSLKRILLTNDKNSDAVGVQVFANPKHFSLSDWYADQKLGGNLGAVQIAGYDALADNNNIYIGAVNIVTSTQNADVNLYTNVYLFSINADARPETRQVFEQLVKNLKFNINTENKKYCSVNSEINCQNDFDCPSGQTCFALIDKMGRNLQRLRDLNKIMMSVGGYAAAHDNTYPALTEGSLLPGQSISTWPSWGAALSSALGPGLPADPINRLGIAGTCASINPEGKNVYCLNDSYCGGFAPTSTCNFHDPDTGWTTYDRRFSFACATSSLAYRYIYNPAGGYNLRTKMESTVEDNGGIPDKTWTDLAAQANTPFSLDAHFSLFSPDGICNPIVGLTKGEIVTIAEGKCGDGIVQAGKEECDPPGVEKFGECKTTKKMCRYSTTVSCNNDSDCIILGLSYGPCVGEMEVQSCAPANAVAPILPCHWTASTTPTYGGKIDASYVRCSYKSVCGNGRLEMGETCDDGVLNGKYGHCNKACNQASDLFAGYCGDGRVDNANEYCDSSVAMGKCQFAAGVNIPSQDIEEEPIFIFLIDLSGSMSYDLDGTARGYPNNSNPVGTPTAPLDQRVPYGPSYPGADGIIGKERIAYVKEALPAIASALSNKIKIGIAYFSYKERIQMLLPVGSYTTAQVRDAVNTLSPWGATYTGPAISFVRNSIIDNLDPDDLAQPKNLILITDGDETIDAGEPVEDRAAAQIEALNKDKGVLTYVLAIGTTGVAPANGWAQKGGTVSSIAIDSAGDSIASEIQKIYTQRPCRTYSASPGYSCAWDCHSIGSYCGDGKVDVENGEECDGNTDCSIVNVAGKNLCSNKCKFIRPAIAWWRFDSVDTRKDYSGNKNHALACTGHCPTSLAGKFGLSANFDGTTSYLAVPDSAALRSAQFSLEAWIKLPPVGQRVVIAPPAVLSLGGNSVVNQGVVISKQSAEDCVETAIPFHSCSTVGVDHTMMTLKGYSLYVDDSRQVHFAIGLGRERNWANFSSPDALTSDWTHVAAVYDGITQSLFVNGVLVSSHPVVVNYVPSTAPLKIGDTFAGQIDELTYYNRALTSDEINYDVTHNQFCSTTAALPNNPSPVVSNEPRCGDGKVDAGEACDKGDGPNGNGIACTPTYNKSCTYCSADCKNVLEVKPSLYCGDGKIQADLGELCEVGNAVPGSNPIVKRMWASTTSSFTFQVPQIPARPDPDHNGFMVKTCAEVGDKVTTSTFYGARRCENCILLVDGCMRCGLVSAYVGASGRCSYDGKFCTGNAGCPVPKVCSSDNQKTCTVPDDCMGEKKCAVGLNKTCAGNADCGVCSSQTGTFCNALTPCPKLDGICKITKEVCNVNTPCTNTAANKFCSNDGAKSCDVASNCFTCYDHDIKRCLNNAGCPAEDHCVTQRTCDLEANPNVCESPTQTCTTNTALSQCVPNSCVPKPGVSNACVVTDPTQNKGVGVSVSSTIINALYPAATNPDPLLVGANGWGTALRIYPSAPFVDQGHFAAVSKFTNANKSKVDFVDPAHNDDIAFFNPSELCQKNDNISVYKMVVNQDTNHAFNFHIYPNRSPGLYDLVLSPTMKDANEADNIRIVATWFGKTHVYNGIDASGFVLNKFDDNNNPSAPRLKIEGAILTANHTDNYFSDEVNSPDGIWLHGFSDNTADTYVQSYTVDTDRLTEDVAFYIRSNTAITNENGNLRVDVYMPDATDPAANHFSSSTATYYLSEALASENAAANYWHVLDIKMKNDPNRDPAHVLNNNVAADPALAIIPNVRDRLTGINQIRTSPQFFEFR